MNDRPGAGVCVGLLLTTLAILAHQLLLTRIFSVTLSYHYSFVAVSVTMFGMTLGALVVYLRPAWFPKAATAQRMGVAGASFAILIVISFLIYLQLPVRPIDDRPRSLMPLAVVTLSYGLISLPFVPAGMGVTLALTRFPRQIGKLYALNLVGAGLGCLAVAVLSRWIDPPVLILHVAGAAAVGAILCLEDGVPGRRPWLGGIALAVLLSSGWWSAASGDGCLRVLRPKWVKGEREEPPLCERWNAFSRVAVWRAGREPFGWGISDRFTAREPVEQLVMTIDAGAVTVMTRFDGDASRLDFLRYDVTNLVHHIRPRAKVLVIGSGGGRDILAALHFRQPQVVGVEVNDAVLEIVHGRYGLFTGFLNEQPGVTIVNDEARTYVARTDRQFDVIHSSLTDTWAATATGAYVLMENSLYTVEGWQQMVGRLSRRGVISFSRWYGPDSPVEIYRLATLAVATLKRMRVDRPGDHLIAVACAPNPEHDYPTGVATLLVGRRPFSDADIDTVRAVARKMGFRVLLTPRAARDELLGRIARSDNLPALVESYPADISPPTDDRPFFFHMLRLGDVFTFARQKDPLLEGNVDTIRLLGWLLVTAAAWTGLCVLVPLGLSTKRGTLADSAPYLAYFCGIGLGFMLVEIALMQRLSAFLGHPIYSMTVVLWCLLLAGGCGSWLSGLIVRDVARGRAALVCLAAAAGTIAAVAITAPPLLTRFQGAATAARIGVAGALLVPLGLVMGTAFPIGMRAATARSPALTPWLVGLNGAASSCGAVLAVVISLGLGISRTLAVGVGCYGAVLLCFLWARWRKAH